MQKRPEFVPVDTRGRQLGFTCWGQGEPTVVLETGLGAESAEWQAVQQEIAQLTRVFRYDRANRGQSDPAPKPRSAQECVADLHELLRTAAIPGPYVLVGHSLGGLIVRLYAHQHPHDVAGLVLVDPMHEDQFDRIGPRLPDPFPGEPETLTQLRRFWRADWRDPSKNDEGIDFPASQAQAHAIDSLDAIPMLILTSGVFVRESPPGNPGAVQLQLMWQQLHGELMRQSSNAQQILVETSGHFIQREQPEVVIAAIQQMLRIVRQKQPTHVD